MNIKIEKVIIIIWWIIWTRIFQIVSKRQMGYHYTGISKGKLYPVAERRFPRGLLSTTTFKITGSKIIFFKWIDAMIKLFEFFTYTLKQGSDSRRCHQSECCIFRKHPINMPLFKDGAFWLVGHSRDRTLLWRD